MASCCPLLLLFILLLLLLLLLLFLLLLGGGCTHSELRSALPLAPLHGCNSAPAAARLLEEPLRLPLLPWANQLAMLPR
jgi:hypothetical protein